MDDPNALGDRMNECGFLFGVLASAFIIVSEDNDVPTREIRFASGRKTVAGTAKRDGERSEFDNGVDVFLSFRPIQIIRDHFTIEGIACTNVGNFEKSVRLASLPTQTAVTVLNVVPIHRTTASVHDLDPDGQRFVPIDMAPLFIRAN